MLHNVLLKMIILNAKHGFLDTFSDLRQKKLACPPNYNSLGRRENKLGFDGHPARLRHAGGRVIPKTFGTEIVYRDDFSDSFVNPLETRGLTGLMVKASPLAFVLNG